MAALEAGYDLGALALCFVALACLLMTKKLTQAVAGILDVGVLGVHPFRGIANRLNNSVVGVLDDAIKGVEAAVARFESGLIDAFGLLIAIPLLLGLGVKAALSYLWDHALRPLIRSFTDPIRDTASDAKATATGAIAAANSVLVSAQSYARAQASDAINSAQAYVERRLTTVTRSVDNNIAAAAGAVVSYVDVSIGKLRAAEDAAIANAVDLAARARTAGELAAERAGAEAEAAARAALDRAVGGITAAEAAAAAAGAAALAAVRAELVQSEAAAAAAATTAIEGVKAIAIDIGDELHGIEGAYGAAGLAALIGSIPLLATAVQTIAVEAGLENASCRGKVKNICATDPTAWAELLGGLGALGLAFSLRELYDIAKPLAGELLPIMREAA